MYMVARFDVYATSPRPTAAFSAAAITSAAITTTTIAIAIAITAADINRRRLSD